MATANAHRTLEHSSCVDVQLQRPEAIGQSLDLMIPGHLRAAHRRGFEVAVNSGALVRDGAGAVLGRLRWHVTSPNASSANKAEPAQSQDD